MRRLAPLLLISLMLTSCAIRGTVSTANLAEPPPNRKFTVVVTDQLSLTERIIVTSIEKKMLERGYTKALSLETTDVAVLYKYSIGTGQTVVSSQPDFVWGGQQVTSRTNYPRFFQIAIVDLTKSKISEKPEIIWQGEVYSSGASSNMSALAVDFLDVLFENYGSTVTNKWFIRIPQ